MLKWAFYLHVVLQVLPLFPIDSEELVKFVLEKRPTLKGKPFRIAF